MRKTIFLLVALVATITNLVAQEEIDHANNALVWDTRTYWTHNSGRTFNTGLNYKGVYVFGQAINTDKDWSLGLGAGYTGAIKNTNYEVIGSYNHGWYAYGMVWQDLHLPVFNAMPIVFIDTDKNANFGLFYMFDLGKNISAGFWVAQPFLTEGEWGFEDMSFEIDVFMNIDVIKNIFKKK